MEKLWTARDCGHVIGVEDDADGGCAQCEDYEEAYRLDAIAEAADLAESYASGSTRR